MTNGNSAEIQMECEMCGTLCYISGDTYTPVHLDALSVCADGGKGEAVAWQETAEKDAALTDERILELLSEVADENMLKNHADEVIAAGRAILAANKEPK
jgi:hypothetical protein